MLMDLKIVLFMTIACCMVNAQRCGPNESWTKCTGCELKCGQNPHTPCTMNCRPPSCFCNPSKNLRRTGNGQCVESHLCPRLPEPRIKRNTECEENEEFLKCPGCEGTCKRKMVPCTRICRPPACHCSAAKNFVRDSNGKCIKFEDC